MSHYIDQCKTDLSSPGRHLHELRKRTLLLEQLRTVKPADHLQENTKESHELRQIRLFQELHHVIPEYEEEKTQVLESSENFKNQRIHAPGIVFKMETEYLDSNVSDIL